MYLNSMDNELEKMNIWQIWNFTPIYEYFEELTFTKLFLFIIVFIIIYLVDYIVNINAFIFSIQNQISLPIVTQRNKKK